MTVVISRAFQRARAGRNLAFFVLLALATSSALPLSALADEIRLKNGKKLYGVIVAYEDNMFKVKTDYGFELVEKDKIASIVPSGSAGTEAKGETQPVVKKAPAKPEKSEKSSATPDPTVASGAATTPDPTNASAKPQPAESAKLDKPTPKISNAPVKPEMPAKTGASTSIPAAAPALNGAPAPAATLTASASQPVPPKEEPPPLREEIQGNLYTNYTHGFRMYKAPSWTVNEDARSALPNAIVALGTFNESTILVVGQEKTKEPLDTAAKTVEKRLHDVYDNYRLTSQRKLTVGGQPAVEFRYRGLADGHDWSGTLAVVARGSDVLTVLGMTYADSDLIQIQENVIARSIASLDFSVANPVVRR
jgi:hypothetical protein